MSIESNCAGDGKKIVPEYKNVILLIFSQKIPKVKLYVLLASFFFLEVYLLEMFRLSTFERQLDEIVQFFRKLQFIHCNFSEGPFYFNFDTVIC